MRRDKPFLATESTTILSFPTKGALGFKSWHPLSKNLIAISEFDSKMAFENPLARAILAPWIISQSSALFESWHPL